MDVDSEVMLLLAPLKPVESDDVAVESDGMAAPLVESEAIDELAELSPDVRVLRPADVDVASEEIPLLVDARPVESEEIPLLAEFKPWTKMLSVVESEAIDEAVEVESAARPLFVLETLVDSEATPCTAACA